MLINGVRHCDACKMPILPDTPWHSLPDGRELCSICRQTELARLHQQGRAAGTWDRLRPPKKP